MIISKTPLRMSFSGGGSDLPSFYERSEGAVVSVAIDKYIYVTVNKKFDNSFRIGYSKTENVKSPEKIKHGIVREVIKKLNINGGLEITSIADIPSSGTGLGSSSSFTVGLLNALHGYKKEFSTPETLAREACEVEIDLLKEPIGKQDQHAAAYGGLNLIRFHEDGSVDIDPIITQKETRKTLEKNVLMFYTGITRSASEILRHQNTNLKSKKQTFAKMKKMVENTYRIKDELQKNNLDNFGKILHENWLLKKEMTSGISSPEIDKWYQTGIKQGALGGKILGAGGGGFLMFYAPHEKHQQIIESLPKLRPVNLEFDYQGSRIIFIH
jgi:D-glycero-alpha-D-manno-heptose-7-phosphate kinase